MRKLLAIDVGGTFTKFAVVSGKRSFKISKRDKIPTVKTSHADFLTSLTNIFKASDNVEGLALSMPGLIDTAQGVCISSAALSFANGHCLAEELQDLFGVRVTVENDANCAALAEVKSGSLVDVKDAVVLVFGTAVGGALIHNKKLYRGAHHCAGEVSFTLNDNDISALAFQSLCAKILGKPIDDVTGELVFELINAGNIELREALNNFAHNVAVKIYNLQMIYDPERFALGGGISAQPTFIDAVQSQLDDLSRNALPFLPRAEVVACKYHNDANLLGALVRWCDS